MAVVCIIWQVLNNIWCVSWTNVCFLQTVEWKRTVIIVKSQTAILTFQFYRQKWHIHMLAIKDLWPAWEQIISRKKVTAFKGYFRDNERNYIYSHLNCVSNILTLSAIRLKPEAACSVQSANMSLLLQRECKKLHYMIELYFSEQREFGNLLWFINFVS